MASCIGVLIDSFDPVRSSQVRACLDAVSSGQADQVILVLPDDGRVYRASFEDRWKMLTAACAGSKHLVPLRIVPGKGKPDWECTRNTLRELYPGESFFPLYVPVPLPAVPRFSPFGNEPDDLCPSVLEYCSVKNLYGACSRLPEAGSWVDRLFEALNPHRFAHSLSVARTAVQLAVRFGIDAVKAEEAGLLHDCAKCLPLPEMQRIAACNHLTDDPEILQSAALLHSIAGSWVARTCYCMEDQEVLDAIAFHNTGHAGMSRLAMCVCLADFIEPNRDSFPLLEDVRRLSYVSLEKALLLSLEGVAAHVASSGESVHPSTAKTVAWLKTLPALRTASPAFANE